MPRYLFRRRALSRAQCVIQELDEAEEPRGKSVEIAVRMIKEIRPMCRGVHIISVGWESGIPQVLRASGIMRGGRRQVGA